MPLIEIKGLVTVFKTHAARVNAVDGIDLTIEPERTLGLVGESGCGKSVTALSILRLIQKPGRIESGEILYHRDGKVTDLVKLDPKGPAMRAIRGNEIAMIFQEPLTSLNPVYTIGNQIMEAITLHQHLGKREGREKTIEALRAVGIPSPEQRVDEYPHQLSGGMRQRAMIAMALSCNPRLLIADEPTTALDVTIQAQVLTLMKALQKDVKAAILFITHDLGVIAKVADHVMVMYLGKMVEHATVRELFHHALHPYTQGLLKSIPSLASTKKERLVPIAGSVPGPGEAVLGCAFEPRCSHTRKSCPVEKPPLREVAPGHTVACWLYE